MEKNYWLGHWQRHDHQRAVRPVSWYSRYYRLYDVTVEVVRTSLVNYE